MRTKYGYQPSRPSGVDSSAAPVCVEPCTMITGQPGADFFARNLELHVHLTDRDLLRSPAAGAGRPGAARRNRRVVGDLRDAADEEAALILENELVRP